MLQYSNWFSILESKMVICAKYLLCAEDFKIFKPLVKLTPLLKMFTYYYYLVSKKELKPYI